MREMSYDVGYIPKMRISFNLCNHELWFRKGPYGSDYTIKFPNAVELFGERNGLHKPIFRFLGFRIFRLPPVDVY